jgi:hypothetical protein
VTDSARVESSSVKVTCDYGDGVELTTVVSTQSPDAHDRQPQLRGLAVAPLGLALKRPQHRECAHVYI